MTEDVAMTDASLNGSAGHDFVCGDCGFKSMSWPTKTAADARGKQHEVEHETGVAMPELAVARNLVTHEVSD